VRCIILEITLAIILSVIALISPSITAWINNRYQLKIEKIKVYEASKKEVLEKFIKNSQAYCVDNTSTNNFSNYVESVLSLYAYFEIKDTQLINDLTQSFSKSHNLETFNLLSTLVSDLSKQISKK